MSKMLTGKILNGRYRVISALGTGGFGTTYLAEDQDRPGHPRCVVKQLQSKSDNARLVSVRRRIFNIEAETLQKIGHHEQIPEFLACFEEEEQFFLVQEFIPGPSLVTEILYEQSLPEPRVTKLLKEILNVLEFIHAKGVSHLNLKANNLIHHQQLDKWVLINFASEKALKEISGQGMGQKRASALASTPPASKSSEPTISPSSASTDIYALGMICLQALTGMPTSEIERDPKTGEIRWPAEITSKVSPKLRNIISKMVFHDSSQRYSSAREVLQALDTSSAFPLPKHSTKPPKSAPSAEAIPQAPKPITSSFNSSLKEDPFTSLPNVPKTPITAREKEPEVRTEPLEASSVFAQPIVDPSTSRSPLWISGLVTLAALLLPAGFVFWIMFKPDANNALVTSKPPAPELSQLLDAKQRALLQEAGTPIKSQPESKAFSQTQKSPLESKAPTADIKKEVPVPSPPQLQIPTAQVPATKTQPKTSVSEALAKSEINSPASKQDPTKANLSTPLIKSEESASTKTEANAAQGSAPVSTPASPKTENKSTLEKKQTEGDKGNSPNSNPVPLAKNNPEISKAETPSPLPSVNPNSESTSPQPSLNPEESRKTIAKVSPSAGRVEISLVNATGTVVSYQVLGNTDERPLYADMRSNLRGLPAPANLSFYRPDRGPIEVSAKTVAPGKIEVTLRRGYGPETDHSFLTVQESGKVILN
ncbi:MAG: protein kinase [Gloeobacterales cyanobacterium]